MKKNIRQIVILILINLSHLLLQYLNGSDILISILFGVIISTPLILYIIARWNKNISEY